MQENLKHYSMRQNSIKAKVIILLQFPKFNKTEENIIYFIAQVPKLALHMFLCIASITCNIICSRVTNHTIITKPNTNRKGELIMKIAHTLIISITQLIQSSQFLAKTLIPQGFPTFQSHKQLVLDSGFMMLTRTCPLVVLPL